MDALFLDDSQERTDTATALLGAIGYRVAIVKDAKAAIVALEVSDFDIICLDHDLGGKTFVDSDNEDCGMEVVRYLVSRRTTPPAKQIIVHSWNAPAADRMVSDLRNAGYEVAHEPFAMGLWARLKECR